ncbi:MFS transporter [Nocardia farcinica]|uniref:MFS transporter n=1 Tax=Nocardia farcinica TaxID=37329 RepID=UPI001895CEEF|nr:MFS transporter [Nocardia farcinica]MBF6387966.1 MFS transporter [Nocardia farcinica]MBF6539301.1 MFS transporter [Nocardia farcinica]
MSVDRATESATGTVCSVRLRSLTWSVFVPMALYGTGAGAAAPMYALRALDLGASAGLAGLVVSLSGLGMVLTDLPAGRVVARVGERGAIGLGSLLGLAGVLAAILAPNLAVLAAGMLLNGAAGAVWGLARQSYLVAVVSPGDRGRALSTLAGAHRLGFFCGPFLGAGLVHVMGPNGGLWLQCVTTLLAGLAMVAVRDVGGESGTHPLSSVVVENRRLLGTLGSAALLTGAARAARQALLPLWAAHIGLSPVATSLIFGIAGAVDVLMSYPAGIWLDRYGRRATGIPSMLCFALGYAALPFTGSALTAGAAAVLLGLANGISNGLIMTVGADVAPPDRRAEFLGAWRLTHDIGMFAGPVAVGAISALAVLGAASFALALAAGAGAWTMYRWFPAGRAAVDRPRPDSGRTRLLSGRGCRAGAVRPR